MANATSLSLKNAAAVAVPYQPIRISTGEFAMYVDRTNPVLNMQSKASLSYSETATVRKVGVKLTFPFTVDGKVNTCIGTANMVIPTVTTLTERQELRARLVSLLADAIVTAACDNGETPW